MDYRDYAKDLLSRKKNLISAYSSIKTELGCLEQEKYSCKTSLANASANGIGDPKIYEERLINLLADIEDCRFRRSVVERELLKIEKGMETLNDYQKDLIQVFFVDKNMGAADELMERWYKERSSLYRDRSRALEQFTRSVFGVVQI